MIAIQKGRSKIEDNKPNDTSESRLFRYLTNTIVAIGLLILTSIIYYYNAKDIELKLAWDGASPQNYIAEKLHPENFRRNWEAAGVGKYDFSLPMRVYFYLAKYCGISPTKTMYPYMFFQTLLFLLSVAFLTQTLFKNKIVTFISVVIIPLSNLSGLNLSRFGNGYELYLSYPRFYIFSIAFRFFAIGFFLKNKYILMSLFLAFSIYCHVNIGIFTLAFIGGYLFYKPKQFCDKKIVIGMMVFLSLVVPHIIFIISNSAITTGGIPADQWIKSTRIFGCHWYPITMKLFSENAHREFFPILVLCFFFYMALKFQNIKDEKNVKIIVGSVTCLFMALLGIIFSDIYSIPFLIKISLQRSTSMITFFGVLYLIYYLLQKVDRDNTFNVFWAIYGLLIFAFSKPGIAVLPLFLLLYTDINAGYFGPLKISPDKIQVAKLIYYFAALFLILLAFTCIFKDNFEIVNSIFGHLWTPLQYFDPFFGYDFLIRGGGFKVHPVFKRLIMYTILCAGFVTFFKISKNRVVNASIIGLLIIGSLFCVWYLERDQYLRWHNRYAKEATSYLDLQLWAKANTPANALFMPDPSHNYGWRDFSERSSFGNLREWGYSAIAYNPDYKIYQEGIKRISEFGIDIKKITDQDLEESKTLICGSKLLKEIRKKYHSMSDEQLKNLSRKYRINFAIMNKKYQKNKFELIEIAYENDHYYVYKF